MPILRNLKWLLVNTATLLICGFSCETFAETLQHEETLNMLDQDVGSIFSSPNGESSSPRQRMHLILLGVEDVQAAAEFYEALGWKRSATGHSGFEKFDLGGYALCLLSKSDLAKDALEPSAVTSSFSGIAFVYLTKTPEEVPQILQKAVEAGGTLVKPATRTPYGIAGYFKDPNGYLFEVDYEIPWVLDDDHKLVVDKLKG